jgi:trans-aconitate 2-methyltransferase
MPNDIWNAQQYLKFEADRLRPFLDLVSHLDADDLRVASVVDLGCGPGNATAMLADWWPDAHITGIDSSPAMIEAAAGHAVPGRLDFELGDVRTWQPDEPVDVVVANAVLQWIPGHIDLLPKLAANVAPGGLLGFQVPGNFQEPSHVVLDELRTGERWRDKVSASTERPASHSPADYLAKLAESGLEPDVWETTYTYILDADPARDVPSGVTEFVRGTALRPIISTLSEHDAADFTAEYDGLVREAYPVRILGGRSVQLLPYRRIFAVGRQA